MLMIDELQTHIGYIHVLSNTIYAIEVTDRRKDINDEMPILWLYRIKGDRFEVC